MKRIFITGGNGFIGTALSKALKIRGHDVYSYDIKDNLLHDVRDYSMLLKAIETYNPTHIIHLGMVSKVTDANESPQQAKDSILGGTLNILQAINVYGGVERLVFASSSTVYGDFIPALSPPNEKHPTNPVNVYGALKLASEILIKSYSKMHDIEYTIVRPSSVYGPYDYNLRVIGKFFLDAMMKGYMTVNGEGMQMDFSYIDDVVKGIIAAMFSEKAVNETFNITRGQTRTLLEAAELVKTIVSNTQIITKNKNRLFPNRGAFDISKARNLLGYNPTIDLPEGIKKYGEHMINCWECYK